MNEEIYNIAYDALKTIMELSNIILEEEHDTETAYSIINAIRNISVQSKYIMLQKKEKADD